MAGHRLALMLKAQQRPGDWLEELIGDVSEATCLSVANQSKHSALGRVTAVTR
jgi:hypothetical protein